MVDNPIIQYYRRAAWALINATKPEMPPSSKSYLTAMSLHASRSLKEAFDQAAKEKEGKDDGFVSAVNDLPHTNLIERVRNMDIHGWPIPVCQPGIRMIAMKAKPGKPISLTSSNGVEAVLTMKGTVPRFYRRPNDLKNAKIDLAQSVSYGCDGNELIVFDSSTGKELSLLSALGEFLKAAEGIIYSSKPAEECESQDLRNGDSNPDDIEHASG